MAMDTDKTTLFDPLAPEVLANPAAAYGAARDAGEVLKVSGRFERDFYIVTSYDDVKNVMNDHARWTKREGALLRATEKDIALSQDPPEFNPFRRIYGTYLGPQGVKRWAEAMHRYVDEYLDALVPKGEGDLHDDIARPLPVRVMATVLGLPLDRLDDYRRWTDFFLLSQFNEPDPAVGEKMMAELYEFLDAQFAAREALLAEAGIAPEDATPDLLGNVLPDSLISLLTVAQVGDRKLTPEERRRIARGFFVGNDTFTSLFLNVLYRLLEDRERWEAVRADRSLVPVAIEESLRCDPPAIGMFRQAACPVDLHGVKVEEGSRILYAIPGANHDPAVFDNPDEFRLDRSDKELSRHLGFGFGAHFCPGAGIARLEAKIAINAVLDRMPDLELLEKPKRIEPFNFYGFKTFHAKW